MKKIISAILAAAMLFSLAACTQVSENSIQPAVYRMEDEQYPRLSLKDDGTFSLVYTADASRITRGTYSVEEKVLKLAAEDGSEYCFNVKRDSVVFDGEISDAFTKRFENEPNIPDSAEFELWRTVE